MFPYRVAEVCDSRHFAA